MRVAVDKVEGWENLKPATKGDNAWLFVNEEVRWATLHCDTRCGKKVARVGNRLQGFDAACHEQEAHCPVCYKARLTLRVPDLSLPAPWPPRCAGDCGQHQGVCGV